MKHQLGIAQSVHTVIYFEPAVPRLEDIVNMVIVSQEDKISPYDILVVVHVNHYSDYVYVYMKIYFRTVFILEIQSRRDKDNKFFCTI